MSHLRRKSPCPCTFSNVTREELLRVINIPAAEVNLCADCQREFTSGQYLKQHIAKCVKANLAAMRKRMDEQAVQLEAQAEQLHQIMSVQTRATQPTQINNYINVNITVNNFGSEDRSYITHDILKKCLESMRISPLVDLLYFNPDHPENHTVKLKSEKKGRLVIQQNGAWIEVDMNVSIDSMIHKENNNLNRYFYEQVWPDPSINFESKTYVQSKLIKINDLDKRYYDERRSIQAKLKNEFVDRDASLVVHL